MKPLIFDHAAKADLNTRGTILDIDRFSTHDGPGIRTVVFLKGCPLKCVWCHSPESQSPKPQLFFQTNRCNGCFKCVDACPEQAISADFQTGRITIDRNKCTSCFECTYVCTPKALSIGGYESTVGNIVRTVARDKPFYKNSGGGVTLSGGELLMQPQFAYHFLKACKENEIHTAIETSGQGSGEALYQIARYTDLIYFDIKLPRNESYRKFTGLGNEVILQNISMLTRNKETCKKIIVRVPCIPFINDSQEDIRAIAKYASSIGIMNMELLKYNAMAGAKYDWLDVEYSLKSLEARDAQYYAQLRSILEEEGIQSVEY